LAHHLKHKITLDIKVYLTMGWWYHKYYWCSAQNNSQKVLLEKENFIDIYQDCWESNSQVVKSCLLSQSSG
jgi:murein endopeptidase